ADLRDPRREGPPAPVRLGRRRRALRRSGETLHRPVGARDRGFHRRGPAPCRPARQGADAGRHPRPGRGDGDGPRPHGRVPGHGDGPPPGRHPRRGLPRQSEELRQPAEVCRQAQLPPGRDPGDRGGGARRRAAEGPLPRCEDRRRSQPRGMEIPAGADGGSARRPRARCPPPSGDRLMADKAGARTEAERLMAAFRAAGALPVEADILQPAEVLLDLYGEDIRARAYVTGDPLRGEMMLRPAFTVPVVQMHMEGGAEPARYCYAGEVFRKQEHLTARKSEYVQVGYEVFDRADPGAADAEVFALFAGLLSDLRLRAVTGDIAILTAAVRGLNTLESRKAALLRHVWRPRRFTQLLD